MPGPYTYPGIYIEEIPSGVRTITGVSTSDTAFVDFFRRTGMVWGILILFFIIFYQLPDRFGQFGMIVEPVADQVDRIRMPLAEPAVILERPLDGMIERRAEQIFLVVEVIIDERRVDPGRLGDVLDRDRGKIAPREQTERGDHQLPRPLRQFRFRPRRRRIRRIGRIRQRRNGVASGLSHVGAPIVADFRSPWRGPARRRALISKS